MTLLSLFWVVVVVVVLVDMVKMGDQRHIPDGINDSSDDHQSGVRQLKKREDDKQQQHDNLHTTLSIKSVQEADLSSVSKASSSKSTIQHPPFFYYQNKTTTQSISNFSLHSNPHTASYETTLTLIILLHIIYFLQWNKRKSRKDISTTYNELINKKQYYKGILAIVSHPPIDGGERDAAAAHQTSSLMMTNGSENGEYNNNTTSSDPIQRSRGIFQRICFFFSLRSNGIYNNRLVKLIYQRILYPFIYGSLSGLPLLTYCSHILWSCRALEELYDVHDGKLLLGVVISDNNVNQTDTSTPISQFSGIGTDTIQIQSDGNILNDNSNTQLHHFDSSPTSYRRVLVALALTTTLLELSLLKSILKRVGQSLTINGRTTTEILSQYAMCSIAGLTTAILGVYDAHFPYTPPPILPFVHNISALSGGFSLILSIMILGMLTYRIHPITSIMSGLLSGSLWSLGVTSFLATRYWGNICILSLILAVLLSLKAQPTYQYILEMIIPCISYVAWDRDGEIPDGSGGQASSRRNTDNEDEENDELEIGSNERYPLLSSSQSSLSGDDSAVIRGRVPVMNVESGESNNSGAEESSMPTSAARRVNNLSRRTGGSSQVPMN